MTVSEQMRLALIILLVLLIVPIVGCWPNPVAFHMGSLETFAYETPSIKHGIPAKNIKTMARQIGDSLQMHGLKFVEIATESKDRYMDAQKYFVEKPDQAQIRVPRSEILVCKYAGSCPQPSGDKTPWYLAVIIDDEYIWVRRYNSPAHYKNKPSCDVQIAKDWVKIVADAVGSSKVLSHNCPEFSEIPLYK